MNETPNYRKVSYTPAEISHALKIADQFRPMERMINVDFESLTKEEYDEWVLEWKDWYSYLSTVSSALKTNVERSHTFSDGMMYVITPLDNQAARMSAIADIRKISNTLLNARLFGKEVRRRISQS